MKKHLRTIIAVAVVAATLGAANFALAAGICCEKPPAHRCCATPETSPCCK